MNDFLLSRLIWRLYNEDGEWKDIWNDKQNNQNQGFNLFLGSQDTQEGFVIWRQAQKNKQIINKGVRWKVGNGRSIQFWDDIWILDHALSIDKKWNGHMDQCKTIFGTHVANYWEEDKWVNLARVDGAINDLKKMLNVVFIVHDEDTLIWKFNPNGLFSISSLYGNTFEYCYVPCQAKAQFKGLTPKVNIFFGILLQDKILSTDNLMKKSM